MAVYIGDYRGIRCYKINEEDLILKLKYNEYSKDIIYILEDGRMIYKEEVFGHYDGKRVEEYEGDKVYTYYWKEEGRKRPDTEMKKEAGTETANGINISEAVGMKVNEIKFSDYSTVVDDFFRNLK